MSRRLLHFRTRTVTAITDTAKTRPCQEQEELVLTKLNRQLAHLLRSNQHKNALHLFDQIHSLHRLKPDPYTLSAALTASAHLRNTTFGDQLHAHAIKSCLKAHLHVANTLLSLYAKTRDVVSVKRVFGEINYPDVYSYTTLLSACAKMGDVGYACEVFDRIPERDSAVMWNAMITGCLESGYQQIGFGLFVDMGRLGVERDKYSFASVLSECSLDFGIQVHPLIIKMGFLATTSVVNALVTMCFNAEKVMDAYTVFDEVEGSVRDEITYNVMLDGLASLGRAEKALETFREMLGTSLRPTELTFVSLMSSCPFERVGRQVHAQAMKMGFEACTSVGNAAISMYSAFGNFHASSMLFEKMEEKDLVTWNAMISSYALGSFGRSAILAYLEMQRVSIEPDEFTFGSLLASSDFVGTVEMIHALLFRNGFTSNIQVCNALISAYSKHGNMKKAYQIFSQMFDRNLISWNTVISGSLLNGLWMEGLELFSVLLITSELRPNVYTLTIALSLCSSISALRHGKQVHSYILRSGLASKGPLGNGLITLYSKCGLLDWSLRIFNEMTERDVVSWNSLLSAYAQHGQGREAVLCFQAMPKSPEIKPDKATFTAVLSACSHAGLVDDACQIFHSMIDHYGIIPGMDHFSCIISLLGRAGHFEEVERLINSKHFEAHPNIWWTLLSACATHGNLELGRSVARFLLETEKDNPSVYVLLSNIYAAADKWEEAAKFRNLIDNLGLTKQPGHSWIDT